MDEIIVGLIPEPCADCPVGVAWVLCYDDVYRCKPCVDRFAQRRGWDQVPESLQRHRLPAPPAPPPAKKKKERPDTGSLPGM